MNKVLIVDDERIVRIGFKSMINWYQHGFELVGTAKNGANALDMVEQYSPDIVFTDLKMPQMDGLELIRQLKRRRYRGKIVALTNYAEYELIREAMVLGASDYLLKVALNPDDLLVVLNKMMTKLSDERRQIEEDIRQEMTQRERQAIMKNMLFRTFLLRPETSAASAEQEAAELGIVLAERPVSVIYLELDSQDPVLVSGKYAERKLLSLVIRNIADEVFAGRSGTELVELGPEQWLAVVPMGVDSHAQGMKMARSLVDTARLYTGLNPCAVVGVSTEGLDQLRQVFRQCREAVRVTFYKGYGFVEPAVSAESFRESDFNKLVKELLEMLQSSEPERFQTVISQIGALAAAERTEIRQLKQCAVNAVTAARELMLGASEPDGAWLKSVQQSLEAARTVQELEQHWQDAVQQLLAMRKEQFRGQYRQEIRNVILYMESHLQDKVTLEDIARVAALNESYLCRLFKQETGHNLFQYLSDLRIEEAKRLFRSTALSVKEVAARVGIDNPFYFSRLFKKRVGQSPNQYRGSHS